ncbi:hypothetical protein WJX72_011275 [[Myrmecia] bisecta]|uniref:Fatty acid desaturase domain-containing protein n=1 Tax=[Myrmecia] bisecta TaxID=41462 RepID=A0AAW1QSV8_9CHLO
MSCLECIAADQRCTGTAPEELLEAGSNGAVVTRISDEGGSRRAFCQAFCRLLNLKLASLDDVLEQGTSLVAGPAPFPATTVPFSSLRVQQKRPYFFNRTWTETDVGYLSFFLGMHAIALGLGPFTFSWDALQVALGMYVVTGMLGLSLSYHRQLSHQSFRCPKWLEYFFAYCGVLSFEGDPVEWSKNHRWHHLHSDTPADRHTPRDGVWHSHMGWLFDEQLAGTRTDGRGNMKDSLAPPWFYKESPEFYGWIRKTYMYHQLGQAAVLLAWGGLDYLVWGFVIRVLFTMHMTWLVNSAVHVWGNKEFRTDDESRNNWLVALLVFGDGWHNNHHAFPASAAHGLKWWQFDASYTLVRGLELVGLAWDVKRPTDAQMAHLRMR